MGELADDPAGNLQKDSVPEMLYYLQVRIYSHIQEVRLQFNYLKQSS
jgi:hypothetical protein